MRKLPSVSLRVIVAALALFGFDGDLFRTHRLALEFVGAVTKPLLVHGFEHGHRALASLGLTLRKDVEVFHLGRYEAVDNLPMSDTGRLSTAS